MKSYFLFSAYSSICKTFIIKLKLCYGKQHRQDGQIMWLSSTTAMWHPSTERSGVWDPAFYSKRPGGVLSMVRWVLGIETLVLAVDPAEACELLQPLWAVVQASLENAEIDKHSQAGEPSWKSRSPAERFQHTVRAKNSHWTHLRGWEEQFDCTWVTPLPRWPTQSQESPSLPMLSPAGDVKACGYLPSLPVQDAARGGGFSVTPSRVLSQELHDGAMGSIQISSQGSEWILSKGHGSH